jgi:hypothetical protein
MLGWSVPGAAAVVTVNVLTDNTTDTCPATCSLRAALAAANAGDEIRFSVRGSHVNYYMDQAGTDSRADAWGVHK